VKTWVGRSVPARDSDMSPDLLRLEAVSSVAPIRRTQALDPVPSERGSLCRDDVDLRDRLMALEVADPQWWDSGRESAAASPSPFVYPGTMVPSIVGQLMDEVAATRHTRPIVLDPFAGSGTVVGEAVARGWDVTAVDINPLAALICRVLAGPYHLRTFRDHGETVVKKARDHRGNVRHSFDGVEKWFERDTATGLARLRHAIMAVSSKSARRFLWVILAESVRLTSNSRLTTVKLHIKSEGDRRPYDAIGVFEGVLKKGIQNLSLHNDRCRSVEAASAGWPKARTRVLLGDMRTLSGDLAERPTLVVTSPPYGDNHTTIAYGQNSWLPLQWIQMSDIDSQLDDWSLGGPSSIDSESLGGSRAGAEARAESVRTRSATADWVIDLLRSRDHFGFARVASFLADMEESLSVIARESAHGAHVVLVVGDRTVAGQRVPTAKVAQEVLADLDGETVWVASRNLPASRRMASRNRFANRMSNEWLMAIRLRQN